VPDEPRYAIGDLADLGGVSRRTVRYYVQEGLLPEPFGLGRGNHYGPEHLDQLLRVKALQEAGRSLQEIRRTLNGAVRERSSADAERVERIDYEAPLPRSMWRRVTLAPGVELHVSSDVRLPAPGRLQELATWCRQYFPTANSSEGEEDGNA
jgi:DNA-binding transcriptional MerR regulator